MDFFKRLDEINGDVTVVIKKSGTAYVAIITPSTEGVKDEAAKQINPFKVEWNSGEIIDENIFFNTILHPVNKAAGIITNMREFEASTEKANAEKAEAKKLKEEEKKTKDNYNSAVKAFQEIIDSKDQSKKEEAQRQLDNIKKVYSQFDNSGLDKSFNELFNSPTLFG